MSNAEYTDRRSELEIPGSAEFSDAILVRAPRSAAERAVHVVVSAVAILLTSLVLFVGGTGELARLVAQLGIFCLAPVTVLILVRWSVKPSRTRAVRTVVLAGALALLWPIFQLIPLPTAILKLVSPIAFEFAESTGSAFAPVSLDVSRSLSSLTWMASLWTLVTILILLPSANIRLRTPSSARPRRSSASDRSERSREVDRVVEASQTIVIFVATLAALISLGHLVTGATSYWGIFTFDADDVRQLRSHWPFVNPNHLCVLLEMGCILVLARFFRASQIRVARDPYRRDAGLGFRLLLQPERIGAEMWYLVLVLFLLLSAVLTFSRAGIAILFVSLAVLWVRHDRQQRKLRFLDRSDRHRSPRFNVFESGVWRLIRLPLAMTVVLAVVLSFVGEGARDLFAKRIEYGLLQDRGEIRLQLVQATWQLFVNSPLAGVGLSAWSDVVGRYAGLHLAAFTLDYAHNDPLQLLAEIGLLGVLIMTIAAAWIIRSSFLPRSPETRKVQTIQSWGLALAVIAPTVHSLVDFPFHVPALAMGIAILVGANLRQALHARGEYKNLR